MKNNTQDEILIYHGLEIDSFQTNYFMQELNIEKLEFSLIGEFKSNGKYHIPENIISILVKLNKKIEKQEEQKLYLSAKCGKYIFNFIVDFGFLQQSEKYASLKLIEKNLDFFGELQEYVSPLVYYRDDNDIYFMEKVKKLFNIISENDDVEGKNKENEELALILIEKKDKNKKALDRYLLLSKNRDKIYVKNILKIFENSGEFGKFALKRYQKLLLEYHDKLNSKDISYYRNLRRLIDFVINNEKQQPKDFQTMIGKVRGLYAVNNEIIYNKSINPQKAPQEKAIKIAKDKGGGSKSSSGSKAKSKDSGSDKKKSVGGLGSYYKPKKILFEEEIKKAYSEYFNNFHDIVYDIKAKYKNNQDNNKKTSSEEKNDFTL